MYVCSLIYTQFDNSSALAIIFNSLVNIHHTLSLGEKSANLCIDLPINLLHVFDVKIVNNRFYWYAELICSNISFAIRST